MKEAYAKRGAMLLLAGALAAAGVLAAGAVAAGGSSSPSLAARPAASGTLDLRFNVQKFQLANHGRQLVGRGNVVAAYRQDGVVRGTGAQSIKLTLQTPGSCKVLHLELGVLQLQLLGLIVNLKAVDDPSIVLDISADSSGALGKLFCQLTGALQTGATKKA